ncbi:hypothetical protein CFC21_008789 [Triticum aestivum]|uniref:At1g61320/AtMIF1 LRR domain-containing protein n=2 Tax=Triticum aestivum TaxID=4565 RepID=A0A3B5Z4L7_WHEAT|nr:protein PFC0760c-like [Triticum aestivum]KAF6991734.1 hypothetical protein CFC21_008789 [Triticum aestivum]
MRSDDENANIPMLPSKLPCLRHLEIILVSRTVIFPSDYILSLVSFLDASPTLDTFILRVQHFRLYYIFVENHSGDDNEDDNDDDDDDGGDDDGDIDDDGGGAAAGDDDDDDNDDDDDDDDGDSDSDGDGDDDNDDHDDKYPRTKMECQHDHLKRVTITGFRHSLIELTIHILKSAPSLERLTLDTTNGYDRRLDGIGKCPASTEIGKCLYMSNTAITEARIAAGFSRRYIAPRVPSHVEFAVLEPCSRCHTGNRRR